MKIGLSRDGIDWHDYVEMQQTRLIAATAIHGRLLEEYSAAPWIK
jgi:hypothetical protein